MTTVESFRSMDDASGAPAIITVDGFSFAFDCLGSPTTAHLISRSSRSPSKRIVALATWKYGELLKSLSDKWHAENRAMYSSAASYVGDKAVRP